MILVFLYIFSFFIFTKASVLEILPKGGYAVLPKESKYNISCTSTRPDIKPSALKWIDNFNKVVVYSHVANLSTVYHEVDGGVNRLMFQKVMFEDNGTYVCFHDNHKASFDIIFYDPIRFSSARQQYLELRSDQSWISCISHGYPIPSTKWYLNGKSIKQDHKYVMRSDGLYVRNVRKTDAGVYTCEATIGGIYNHTKSFFIKVDVEEVPRIVKEQESLSVLEDTDLGITFEVKGTCPCRYNFTLDDKEILASARVTMDGGTLYFSPVHRSDQGLVGCRVSNNVGNDSAVTALTVIVRPKVLSFEGVGCEVGRRCGMKCRVEGEKGMVVNITKATDNTSIETSLEGTDTHTFWFEEVSPSNAGKYTCSVLSEVGRHSLTASLIAQYKPKSKFSSLKVYTWKGQSINMSCQVDAVPRPNFKWISRKKDVATDHENKDVFTLYDTVKTTENTYLSVLTLHMNEAKFRYYFNVIKCIAHNVIGNETVEFDVNRAMVPNIAAYEGHKAYPQEIWLSLKRPEFDGYEALQGYLVEVRKEKKTIGKYNFTLDESIRIRELEPSTAYELRYHALNRVGVGIVAGKTISTTAPRKPYPLTITSSNTSHSLTSYRLKWLDPIQVGLPNIELSVKYRRVDASTKMMEPLDDWTLVPLPAFTTNTVLLTNLEARSTYQLSLNSKNKLGRSEAHEAFYFETTPIGSDFVGNVAQMPILNSRVSTVKEGRLQDSQGSKGTPPPSNNSNTKRGLVFFLVLLVLVVFFVLVDGSCYYLKGRSLTATLCLHLRGNRKQLFRKEVSDAKTTPHSNSRHLLQPEVESANNHNTANNNNTANNHNTASNHNTANNHKCARQSAEMPTEPLHHPLIISSSTTNSTNKSEACSEPV